METLTLVLMLVATFCWATAQIIGKVALRNTTAMLFNAVRFSSVAIVVVLITFLTGSLSDLGPSAPLAVAVLSGVLGWFCACQLYYYSLKRDAAHRVIPTGNAFPFWIIALGPLILGEEIKMVLPISTILIFLGSLFLVVQGKRTKGWRMGVPLACFAAFLWGLQKILDKYAINEGMAVLTLLTIRIIVAAILFNVALGISRHRIGIKTHRSSMGLSVLSGIIGLLIGSFMYLSALHMEKVSALAPLSGMTIFFGFSLSIFILGERPTKKAVLGAVFILMGVFLITI